MSFSQSDDESRLKFQKKEERERYFSQRNPVSHNFIPDDRMIWIEIEGLPLKAWTVNAFKRVAGNCGEAIFVDDDAEENIATGRASNNDQNLHSTNELEDEEGEVNVYWAPNIESKKDKSTTNSLERKDDEGPSLDGGSEHEEPLDNLDDDVEKDIEDCRVRPVKAAVNDSSIVSPSTPSVTDLNLAEESCSTWLDYVGPLITNELDSEKRWNYRDPDGNVQGSFSLAQL
nr:RNA-directed DNA polymerase, eukaryota [Tanacetum cinerariifolium]